MKILITICGRGGSKGIPGKNIRPVNGKPLIAYTIESAKRFAKLHDAEITLSTDDDDIHQTAANHGLLTSYRRPLALGEDHVGKIDVIKDVLAYEEKRLGVTFDLVLDLDITSPLRTTAQLNEGLEMILNDNDALTIFSVSPAGRNPYFNMVEKKENGYFGLVNPPQSSFLTRQSSPVVYDMNASFYFYRRSFFDLEYKSALTSHSLIYLMETLCFDLDEEHDFEYLDFIVSSNKFDFS